MATRFSHATILGVKLPSCAILAMESCVIAGHYGVVFSNEYNKLFQLSPSIYLGCFGHCSVFEEVTNKLRVKCPELGKDISLKEASVLVEETVNEVLLAHRNAKTEVSVGFLLIGIDIDNRFSMYTITKGGKTWKQMYAITKGAKTRKHRAKKEKGMVAMVGSEHVQPILETHLKDNKFTKNMSEEEAVRHAFEAIKYETEHSIGSAGEIKVVAVSHGVSTIYKWKQDYPCCGAEYHEQPRIRIHFDQALAPHDGVTNEG